MEPAALPLSSTDSDAGPGLPFELPFALDSGSSSRSEGSGAEGSPGEMECRWGGRWPLDREADREAAALLGGGREGPPAPPAEEEAPCAWDPAHWGAREVLAHNDAFRRLDGPSGLLRLEACGGAPPAYDAELPTFVPPGWKTEQAPLPDPETAAVAFADAHPQVATALRAAQGQLGAGIRVAAAGGAATGALVGFVPGDVDIFLWGPGLADERARWLGLHRLALQLRRAFLRHGPQSAQWASEALSPGVLSLVFYRRGPRPYERKVQVILRAYPSLSAVLHGFDLPSCAVAFDGAGFFLTAAARFALGFRLNPVVPAYRSPTYEGRLAKYFSRGFGVVLLDLRPGALEASAVALPFLDLRPALRCARRPLASGALLARGPAPASDYLPSEGHPAAERNANLASVLRALGGAGPAAPPALRVFADFDAQDVARLRRRRFVGRTARPPKTGLPFARYAEEGPPDLASLAPAADLEAFLRRRSARAFQGSSVNVVFLRDSLGMAPAEIEAFVADCLAFAAAQGPFRPCLRRFRRGRAPLRVPGLAQALEPFWRRRLAQLEALPPLAPWWVVDSPAAQFSGSFQPRRATVAEWYGAFALDEGALAGAFPERGVAKQQGGALEPGGRAPPPARSAAEEELGRLLLEDFVRQNREKVFGSGSCSICLGSVEAGQHNSVVLFCGHVFHAARSPGCRGVNAWLASHGNRCPCCRRKATAGHGTSSDSGNSSDGNRPAARGAEPAALPSFVLVATAAFLPAAGGGAHGAGAGSSGDAPASE